MTKNELIANILFVHEKKNPSPPSFLTNIYKLWQKWQTGLMVFLEKAREYIRTIKQKNFYQSYGRYIGIVPFNEIFRKTSQNLS